MKKLIKIFLQKIIESEKKIDCAKKGKVSEKKERLSESWEKFYVREKSKLLSTATFHLLD